MEKRDKNVSLCGEVSRIKSNPTQARNGDYRYSGIELKCDSASARTFIIFPDFSGDDFFEFPMLCWPGARIAANNLSLNNRLDDGSLIYCVCPDSELLLEPFRPVSVVEAVESFKCVKSIDLRYRFRNEEPFWLAKGRAIHSLFDSLVCNPLISGDDLFFESIFGSIAGGFAQALPGSSASITYEDLKDELRKHYNNLSFWVSNRFGKTYNAETELDIVSVRYGLKGRADAVFSSNSSISVVEIKSGKFTSEDHLLQLLAYEMLIGEDYERHDLNSYVVYSATGLSKRPDSLMNNKRAILKGRNRSVALRRNYAFGDNQCDPELFDDCDIKPKCHSKPNCEAFYGSATMSGKFIGPEKRRYYDLWFKIICLDEWIQETEFSRVLDRSTLSERLAEGITIPLETVRLVQKYTAPVSATYPESPDSVAHPSRPLESYKHESRLGSCSQTAILVESKYGFGDLGEGDEVVVHNGDTCSRDAIRARVSEIFDDRLTLASKMNSTRLTKETIDFNPPDRAWYIDKIPFLRAREMSRKSLLHFLEEAPNDVVETVTSGIGDSTASGHVTNAGTISETEYEANLKWITNHGVRSAGRGENLTVVGKGSSIDFGWLNQDQRNAVARSVNAGVYHLVHGPPGTGKTQVISRIIIELVKRGERVLVTAPTNIALDRVLISLVKVGFDEFLRIGNKHNCSAEFLRLVESKGIMKAHLEQIAATTRDFDEFRNMVLGARLIGATAYQCASNPIFLKQRFDVVVIDEAGQLDEPATLAPLSLASRFILCGDHLQLPPVVKSRNQVLEKYRAGLEISLFERLFRKASDENISPLNVQYRMNSEIQKIPSNLFYDGKLEAAPEVARRRLRLKRQVQLHEWLEDILDPETPVMFVDVPGGTDNGKARPEEAQIAFEITRALVSSGIAPSEIGIITPYRAQQSLIRQNITALKGSSGISVDTVDRFQGGEREVIIISLARSDSVTSFLADPKRLNVSLSRARSKLILLGRASVLEEHPLFCAIFDGLKKVVINKNTGIAYNQENKT